MRRATRSIRSGTSSPTRSPTELHSRTPLTPPRWKSVGRPEDPAPSPFLRTELENGVPVLVRKNPAQPIVAVDLWLAVGTIDEPDEHVGISHFLEHMFFKGTERFPLGALDRVVKEVGGYTNAGTSLEFTHYYVVAPSAHFETVLDLLVDHLLNPALPGPELDRERTVVKEEIRRRHDSPQGRLFRLLSRAVFGANPYGREVLGSPESLDRITVDAMRDYWSRFYGADRLALVVSGDVDEQRVGRIAGERLGGLGGTPTRQTPGKPAPNPASVSDSMEVKQGYLAWGQATPGRSTLTQLAALEVATSIIGDGVTSRLYRRLVDELRLATSVGAWSYALADAGLFAVDATLAPERRSRVEKEIVGVLQKAIDEGFDAGEVRRAQTMLRSEFAFANETNAGATGTLGEFEVLFGDPLGFARLIEHIDEVTPQSAQNALARWARPENAVRAWVGPDGA